MLEMSARVKRTDIHEILLMQILWVLHRGHLFKEKPNKNCQRFSKTSCTVNI